LAFVYFLVVLLGIFGFALLVNFITGTKATYLKDVRWAAGELELWRDANADFARRPRYGAALVTSFPRLRRHTIVWTNRRIVVTQRVLFGSKHMLTHQIVFESTAAPAEPDDAQAASEFSGGFYGRGFETIAATGYSFTTVNDQPCARIQPSDTTIDSLNLAEAYIFSDRLAELERALADDATL
jgi:hypothetical protein